MEEDLGPILLVSRAEVMIERDSWGHSYLIVRGEILGFMKDESICQSALMYIPVIFATR